MLVLRILLMGLLQSARNREEDDEYLCMINKNRFEGLRHTLKNIVNRICYNCTRFWRHSSHIDINIYLSDRGRTDFKLFVIQKFMEFTWRITSGHRLPCKRHENFDWIWCIFAIESPHKQGAFFFKKNRKSTWCVLDSCSHFRSSWKISSKWSTCGRPTYTSTLSVKHKTA